ncbi:uncharacterized protein PSFLO_07617 [Pseudozyma flocculosa]|uniref:Uncharacterized protein n=1 Tax=Pseudozyma flocculosa TaxID=84751 RepID=A0A5C3FCH5_9BASI|nr:uncharacterized protein PSFLO_07617 [Pseudozyma flocculosa]
MRPAQHHRRRWLGVPLGPRGLLRFEGRGPRRAFIYAPSVGRYKEASPSTHVLYLPVFHFAPDSFWLLWLVHVEDTLQPTVRSSLSSAQQSHLTAVAPPLASGSDTFITLPYSPVTTCLSALARARGTTPKIISVQPAALVDAAKPPTSAKRGRTLHAAAAAPHSQDSDIRPSMGRTLEARGATVGSARLPASSMHFRSQIETLHLRPRPIASSTSQNNPLSESHRSFLDVGRSMQKHWLVLYLRASPSSKVASGRSHRHRLLRRSRGAGWCLDSAHRSLTSMPVPPRIAELCDQASEGEPQSIKPDRAVLALP